MKVFVQRNNLKETIPLMALMVAMNVILNAASTYIPFVGIFASLFLPLVSIIFAINTKVKFYPIYFVCSLGLALATTPLDFTYTLMYLLPSLLAALLFSFCIKKRVDSSLAFYFGTIILFVCEMGAIPLLNFIYSMDILENILTIFSIQNIEHINDIKYSIIFIVCALKAVIVYLITKDELERLSYNMVNDKVANISILITTFILCFGALHFWFNKIYDWTSLCLVASFLSAIILSINIFKHKNVLLDVFAVLCLLGAWILYVAFIPTFGAFYALMTLAAFPFSIALLLIIEYIINVIKKRNLIKNSGLKIEDLHHD